MIKDAKTKVVVEISSTYKPDDLGVMQLLISAANHDGAKVEKVQNIPLKDINPHVILFAKGYYKRGATPDEDIQILKEIFAEYTGTPIEYMYLYQCFYWVSETAQKLLSMHQMIRCIQEMHVQDPTPLPLKVKYVKNNDANISLYSLMMAMMSEIGILTVDDIPNWEQIKAAKYPQWKKD